MARIPLKMYIHDTIVIKSESELLFLFW